MLALSLVYTKTNKTYDNPAHTIPSSIIGLIIEINCNIIAAVSDDTSVVSSDKDKFILSDQISNPLHFLE